MNSRVLAVDGLLIRLLGFPYLRLTRDALIHERCGYLVASARKIGRGELRVLDVGCGSGLALYYLAGFCRDIVRYYVGIDREVRKLQRRWDFVRLPHSFESVELDEEWDLGRFDLVWCSEVIEHIIDDERLFHRMAYHLTESGRLIITTPSRAFVEKMGRRIPGFARVSPTQDGGHVRMGYELRDFEKMAPLNNLSVVSHAWLSQCSDAEARARHSGRALHATHGTILNSCRGPKAAINGTSDDCGEHHWSLAVSFRKAT